MTYLDSPSLVFTGDFQSDVSTVNNDVRHYDNLLFEPRFQTPEEGNTLNGWWNPEGGAIFRFIDCKIVRCIESPGVDIDNDIVGAPISGADNRSGGKMVDLDPQMQMTSEIWGVQFRLTNADNEVYFEGKILETGFRDLQQRQFEDSFINGQPSGATFCTVIEEVVWNDDLVNGNSFLQTLKDSTDNNQLRLHLSTYGYYYSHEDGRFAMGKIIGTVAPWKSTQPLKFSPSRRLYGLVSHLKYTNFTVDYSTKKFTIDLGMSIPINDTQGTIHPDFTHLKIICMKDGSDFHALPNVHYYITGDEDFAEIGLIDIPNPTDWLNETGGIVTLSLDDTALSYLENNQVLIMNQFDNGNETYYKVVAREQPDGWFIRADQNVKRLDPDNTESTDIYAFQWGQPVEGKTIDVTLDPPLAGQGGSGSGYDNQPEAEIPDINTPEGKVVLSTPSTTDANGKTSINLTGNPPGNPRIYLDGQIYLFSYDINGIDVPNRYKYWNDKIIVHLRDAFDIIDNPTWDDVKEIWIQFGNLYPIMSHYIFDFSEPDQILQHKNILLYAFQQPFNSPSYMPVTRDISYNKMQTLIKWLNSAQVGTPVQKVAAKAKQKYNFETVGETALSKLYSNMNKIKAGQLFEYSAKNEANKPIEKQPIATLKTVEEC